MVGQGSSWPWPESGAWRRGRGGGEHSGNLSRAVGGENEERAARNWDRAIEEREGASGVCFVFLTDEWAK
jgi:hypothetical protein